MLKASGSGARAGCAIVLLGAIAATCVGGPTTAPGTFSSTTHVTLHGHDLALHLTTPAGVASDAEPVMLVYATGDAGWWGKDRAMYIRMAQWGYPVIGFSSREYVHHLGDQPVSPQEIADDYQAIIARGRQVLGLATSSRAVLVGKSRGAGLAVAAAGVSRLKPELAGVVAVGLTREEEYAYRPDRRRPRQRVMLDTYGYLPGLGDLPLAVIQSARDRYVPAAEARQLFGPDTPVREFVTVNGRDHNFAGAQEILYREMERCIQWIVQR